MNRSSHLASKVVLLFYPHWVKIWSFEVFWSNCWWNHWKIVVSQWSWIKWICQITLPEKLHHLSIYTGTCFDSLTSILMKSIGESVCRIDLEPNESAISPCLKSCITFLSTLGQNLILWSIADEMDWKIVLSHWSWNKWICHSTLPQKLYHLFIHTGTNFER